MKKKIAFVFIFFIAISTFLFYITVHKKENLNPVSFNLPVTAIELPEKRTDKTATFEISHGHFATVSDGGSIINQKCSNKIVCLFKKIAKNIFPFVFADSSGPNSPGTLADNNAVGTLTWTNPSNAASSNNSHANAAVGQCEISITHYLKATNFGFSIPSDSTIDGIVVEIERKSNAIINGETTVDTTVKILKGGVVSGNNKADTSTNWPSSDAYATYGTSSDLWGLSLTDTDVNNSTFGVVVSATIDDSFCVDTISADIDHVRITVYYTAVVSISISGTVYTDQGTTTMSSGRVVSLSLNGASANSTSTTNASGTFTLSNASTSAGDVAALYLDGATEKATTVTIATGATQTGIDLYQNHLITRCDNSSCSLTNANLATADNNGDADIAAIYSVATSTLTTSSSVSLFIPTSHIFAPGGNVVVNGNFINSGTYTRGTETLMLNGTGPKTFTPGTSTYNNVVINDGLVGYWKFDEPSFNNSSSVIDYSGYGNNGTSTGFTTASGPTSTVPSQIKFNDPKSLNFDGSNDYVQIARRDSLNLVYNFSISLWMRPSSVTTEYWWIAKNANDSCDSDSSYGIRSRSSGIVDFRVGNSADGCDSASTATNSIAVNTWYHFVGVHDSSFGTLTLYKNGVVVATDNALSSTRAGSNSADVFIGKENPTAAVLLGGQIDDVRIYNRILSVADINALAIGNQPATRVASSTITLGSALTVAGNLSLNSGLLDTSSTQGYGITVSGNWLNNGGLFTPNNGTVTLASTSTGAELLSGGQLFNNVTVNGSGGTYFLDDRLYVSSTLTLTAGTLNVATGTTAYTLHTGAISQTSGFFTASSGRVVIDSFPSSTLAISSTLNNLSIELTRESGLIGYWKFDEGNGSSTRDWSGNGVPLLLGISSSTSPFATSTVTSTIIFDNPHSLNFNGISNYTSSSANINGIKTVSFWAYSTTSNATFLNLNGTAGVNATGTTLNASGWTSPTYYVNGVSTTTRAASTWQHIAITTDTSINATAFTIGRIGNSYFSGLIDDVRLYSRALTSQEVANLAAGRYAAGHTAPTITLGANLSVSTTTLDSGQLYTAAKNLTVSNPLTILNGNGQLIGGSGNIALNSGFTLSGGLFNGSSSAVTVTGAVTISAASSTLNAPGSSGNLTISGNFAHASGTFTHNSGTVTFNSSTQTISGSTTFYNFTKSVVASSSLTFASGTTQIIAGTLTLQGAMGELLSLESTQSGSQWLINPQGTVSASYLSVIDSNNINAIAISCTTGCNNLGNNTNWSFVGIGSSGGGDSESSGGGTQQTGGTGGGSGGDTEGGGGGGQQSGGGGQGGGEESSGNILETIGWMFTGFMEWLLDMFGRIVKYFIRY